MFEIWFYVWQKKFNINLIKELQMMTHYWSETAPFSVGVKDLIYKLRK